ncbi:MAG: peptide chain release factor N(5)-glutamine methyltransferase [Acidimicrobiales bacterium]
MTRHQLEREVAARLGSVAEARWVVGHAMASGDGEDSVRARVHELVAARLGGDPLQYVLGEWSFRSVELTVDRRALIPRPETEQVVEAALAEVRAVRDPLVVDVGTGSGAVALAVAVERPDAVVWATDVDPGALALAGENVARVDRAVPGVARRVRIRAGTWFDALPPELEGRVDLVVSNPPYVSEPEWEGLDPEVRREPVVALVAGPGSDGTPGLAGVEAVLRGAGRWLSGSAAVVVELAPSQAGAAVALARQVGLDPVRVVTDLSGRDRAVVGLVAGR